MGSESISRERAPTEPDSEIAGIDSKHISQWKSTLTPFPPFPFLPCELQAIYRTDTPPGPAGSWLISRFKAQGAGAAEAANQRSILSASRNR